jgi:pimeloyl-ACP methyl ester carboxylesterase
MHLALLHPLGGDVILTSTFAVLRAFLPLVRFIPESLLRRPIRSELTRWFGDPIRARVSVEQYLGAWQKPARWRQFLRQLAALNAPDMVECTSLLSSLTMPVAIVASDDDPAVPRVALDRVREALPNATLDIVSGVRHFSPEESPERIADVVARLIRS